MTTTHDDVDELEADMWPAADDPRANPTSDYSMPVLVVTLLRDAANSFHATNKLNERVCDDVQARTNLKPIWMAT